MSDWTLVVYIDGRPRDLAFPDEATAREHASELERAGWTDGIPDTLRAPDGTIAWHRAHDAAG